MLDSAFTLVARHDGQIGPTTPLKRISRCEHGTTQLAWDSVSVRIPLQRLGAMSHALQECSLVARRFRIASTGEVCIVFDQHDLYQVWFAGVGLCLSPDEF